MSAMGDRMLGASVGSYKVLQPIGQGGMGAVYVAEHALLGQRVAIKVLLPQYSADLEVVNRFINEARATSQIKHPGIVKIFDFGQYEDGRAYIVMELLEGESLTARLRSQRVQKLNFIAEVTRQLANALAAAHAKSIVHRDLKPDNVFLVEDHDLPLGFRVKILDFGIAKLQGDGVVALKTKTGLVMGTPFYMSPEQCKGAGQVDRRADLYSIGCIMFQMAAGRPPFVYEGGGEILAAHIFQPPPSLREVEPDAPFELEPILARLLAKNPDDRYGSAAELVAAMEALVPLTASGRFRPPSPPTQPMALVAPDAPTSATPHHLPAPVEVRPTTLSGTASELVRPNVAPRRAMWFAVAGVLVGGGLALYFVMMSSATPGPPQVVVAAPPPKAVEAPKAAEAPPPKAVEPELAPPTQLSARIESHPSAAEVLRDGVRIGRTPLTLPHPSSDDLKLVVQLKGYQAQEVTLAGDRDDSRVVSLSRVKSSVKAPKSEKDVVFDPFKQ